MVGLGPAFGNKEIKGPVLVCYLQFQGRDLYLLGEEEKTNGTFENDLEKHAVNQIIRHTRTADEDSVVYSEKTFLEMRGMSLGYLEGLVEETGYRGVSPSATLGYYIFKQSRDLHNLRTILVDSKHRAPYDVYLLCTDPMLYFVYHYRNNSEKIPIVKQQSVLAKEAIEQHVVNENDALRLIESLYMPGQDYLEWYKQLLDHELSDELREKMEILRQRNQDLYYDIVRHMRSYYKKKQPRKQPMELYTELSGYLLDLTVILDFLISDDKTTFLFANVNNVCRIVRFFDNKTTVYYKNDPGGNIPSGHAFVGASALTFCLSLYKWQLTRATSCWRPPATTC